MAYKVLNNDNFDETIKSGVVLVDFWATWCGPCKMLAPTIDEIADEYDGKAVVGKVDVDDCPDLAQRFGIMSIPTIYIFKDGEPVDRLIGYRLKMELEEALNKHLA